MRSIFRISNVMSGASSSTSPFFSPRRMRSQKPQKEMGLKEKLEKNSAKTSSKRLVPKATVTNAVTEGSQSPIKKKDINIPTLAPDLKQSKWEPKDWKEVLEKLRIMRKSMSAPVDTMGCHMCSDEKASPKDKRFHILIALMLSSQTKDAVND